MPAFLEQLVSNTLQDGLAREVLQWQMERFLTFTLVLVRISGLMVIGPLFGQRAIPGSIRILLVFTTALLVTPLIEVQSRKGAERLDVNQDGQISQSEVPESLRDIIDDLRRNSGLPPDSPLPVASFHLPQHSVRSVVDYAAVAVNELSLGLVLGLGVLIVMTGVQLAGELIDQQTGIALGDVFNPGFEMNGSATGQLMFMLSTLILLLVDGHVLMLLSLMETFQLLPLGGAHLSQATIQEVVLLLQPSLILAVQVAAPMLATMSLVALAMGFLGHTVPQINVLVVGFPVRAMINIAVLAFTLSGMSANLVSLLPGLIRSLSDLLISGA
ncbi:MAG: flagellar biosynthetic protein FliR [Planctomycetaceae bacterium]